MDVDVVVVGAGALGLSTALHCAMAGRPVAVVDRRGAGSQASGRAAGLFKSVQAGPVRTMLARRSIHKALTFEEWAGVPLTVTSSGSLLVARSDAHKALLTTETARSRSWGVELAELSPAEAAGRASYYCPGGDELAVWCPEDIYIEEPAWLMDAYLAACKHWGVEVFEHEAVTAVLTAAGAVTGVQTTARRLESRAVVDAAGAWVRQVGELAGAFIAASAVRHQLLVTAPLAEAAATAPIVRVLDAAVYLRPARGGLMVGGFEPGPLGIDPRAQPPQFDTGDVPLDGDVLRSFASQVAGLVPVAGALAAGDVVIAEHRGGMFTMTPDGRFLAGPAAGVPGLWVASGCNGSGFSCSLALGEALAAWITGGEPAGGMGRLSPGRFGRVADQELAERGAWQYAHYYDPAAAEPA